MRQTLTTFAELVGLALISAGLGLAWLPLGVIGAGVSCVLVGYLTADEGRPMPTEDE